MDTQVLIVGAGPVGLMLAIELRRRGVECRLIDSLDAPQHWDRATVVQMNIDYAGSPIVAGDGSGAGARLPDLGPVQLPGEEPRRLHELTHRPGHTLLLLAGEGQEEELAALLAEAQGLVDDSELFEAVVALGTESNPAAPVGHLDPAAAETLGVGDFTVLAIRPDRHLGFRADTMDLAGLRGYEELLRAAPSR